MSIESVMPSNHLILCHPLLLLPSIPPSIRVFSNESWQIDGETVETVAALFSGAPKSLQMVIAAMKLKETYCLEVSYDQLRQHIKKQRHYFVYKVHLVKAMVLPVLTYGCDSWTIKKDEGQRIDA